MYTPGYIPVIRPDPTEAEFEEIRRICVVEQPLCQTRTRPFFATSRNVRRVTGHPLNLSQDQMHELVQRLEISANGRAFFDWSRSYEGSKWLEFVGYGKDAMEAMDKQAEWYKERVPQIFPSTRLRGISSTFYEIDDCGPNNRCRLRSQ